MTLLSGDPLFKRPTSRNSFFYSSPPNREHAFLTLDSSEAATESVSRVEVEATRINAEDVIQDLLDSNLSQAAEENREDMGLHIHVGRDGTATLCSK